MSEVTLTVPAKYADNFRAALAHEVGQESGYVKEERRDYLAALVYERENAHDGDLRGAMKILCRDAELLVQAGSQGAGDIEISMEDEVGAVPFAFETVARDIVGPQLVEMLEAGPYDSDFAPKLRA